MITPLKTRLLALRRGLLVSTLAGLAGLSACEDPFPITASASNIDATFELWALEGAPAAYPAGLLVAQASVVRLDAQGQFDLAFDIDDDGRVRVMPVNTVIAPVSGTREIQFLRGDPPYNTIIEAPRTGWQTDSVLIVNPGGIFLAKVNTQWCTGAYQTFVYAKFVVDSVIPEERRMKISSRVNPNCGFRALTLGLPEY